MKNSLLLALAMVLVALPLSAQSSVAAELSVESTGAAMVFTPTGSHGGVVVTVSTPDGTVRELRGDGPVSFSLFSPDGTTQVDGSYQWDALLLPKLTDADRQALADARETGDASVANALRLAGSLDSSRASGAFAVVGGAFVIDDGTVEESFTDGKDAAIPGKSANTESTAAVDPAFKAQVIANDLVVQGSECVGQDCVNGETFGFDTLRLKENNLRFNFQDTSNSASFPSTDWRLEANSSDNGGASYFAIQDADTGRNAFVVEAGASGNSLYVDDASHIGINTSTPVVSVHARNGNTPALRLDQDGSSGFTSQVWDIAGNEVNFFVRDITNSSKLPFRIEPGTPENSLYLDSSGKIGMGTNNPAGALEIRRSDTAKVVVTNTTSTSDTREVFRGTNFGPPRFAVENSDNGSVWFVGQNTAGSLVLSKNGTTGNELRLNGLDEANSGRATFQGEVVAQSFNPPSDRNLKTAIHAVDVSSVLAKVVDMPISSWQFISDTDGKRHIGPMAQDFYAAFGLGLDERHIATVDADGVALASIQALHQELEAKDARIETLEQRLAALESALEALAGNR